MAFDYSPVDRSDADSKFATPPTDKIDRQFVAYIRTMNIGDSISLGTASYKTPRALKVAVNKNAKEAHRKFEFADVTDADGKVTSVIARIAVVDPGFENARPAANGASTTEAATEETATTARGRR